MVYREEGRRCPSCRGAFFADDRFGGFEQPSYACGECGAALLSFAAIRERAPALAEALFLSGMARPINPRMCPRCDEPMRALEWNEIVVEVCDAHGIWFDKGEIPAAAR